MQIKIAPDRLSIFVSTASIAPFLPYYLGNLKQHVGQDLFGGLFIRHSATSANTNYEWRSSKVRQK